MTPEVRDHEQIRTTTRKYVNAVTQFVRRTLFHPSCIFLLALLMLFVQLNDRFIMRLGINLVRLARFQDSSLIFHNPWQYRVLSFWLLDAWYWLLGFLHIEFSDTPLAYTGDYKEVFFIVLSNEWPLLLFKLLQNILLLAVAYKLYRSFTSQRLLVYLGLILLAYGLGVGNFNSDLSFNTYFDVIFYLCACVWLLQKKYHYLPFLMIVAALNRETSALIPILLLLEGVDFAHRKISDKRAFVFAGVCISIYIVIFFSLRFHYGYAPAKAVYNLTQISDYAAYNLTLPLSYMKFLMVFSVLPVIAIFTWRLWPEALKKWFWGIVPIWFVIHFCMSVVAESRLFYVPLAIIFVPAILAAIDRSFSGSLQFEERGT